MRDGDERQKVGKKEQETMAPRGSWWQNKSSEQNSPIGEALHVLPVRPIWYQPNICRLHYYHCLSSFHYDKVGDTQNESSRLRLSVRQPHSTVNLQCSLTTKLLPTKNTQFQNSRHGVFYLFGRYRRETRLQCSSLCVLKSSLVSLVDTSYILHPAT
jgi:hypothetical protein